MDTGQNHIEDHNLGQVQYTGGPSSRIPDIITVLNGLREEVTVLEVEIQKVESELLADSENKVLNRKFERLVDEKRNKEGRRERLESQLTGEQCDIAGPPDYLYPGSGQAHALVSPQPDLQITHQHPLYHLHHGLKRSRDDAHPNEFHQGHDHSYNIVEGIIPQAHNPPKGTGRGGKGGHKFCKRCKERITYGHQQKCKYCRICYDENKDLVLRAECPHGHNSISTTSQQMMMMHTPLEQHQAALEAQQHQLQLHMQAAGQANIAQMGMHHLAAHMPVQTHQSSQEPDSILASQQLGEHPSQGAPEALGQYQPQQDANAQRRMGRDGIDSIPANHQQSFDARIPVQRRPEPAYQAQNLAAPLPDKSESKPN